MFSFFDPKWAEQRAKEVEAEAKAKIELIKKVIVETPGPAISATAYLFTKSFDAKQETGYCITQSNCKNKDLTPSMIGQGYYTFLQYENLFLLRKSALGKSLHEFFYTKLSPTISHQEIHSAGDVLVNKQGIILYCTPQSGGFKGYMREHLAQMEAKDNSAKSYKELINMPGVILYDCTFKPLKVFDQFFNANGTPKVPPRTITLAKNIKKPLLERLKNLGPNILVDEERFNALHDEFSLKFFAAFADEYEKTYKKAPAEATAAPDDFTSVMPGTTPRAP